MRLVALVLFDERDRALLALRPPCDPYPARWEVFGGKADDAGAVAAADPRAALCAEVKRELGVRVEVGELRRVVGPGMSRDEHVYVARQWTGAPRPRKAQCLAWAPLDATLLQLELTPLTKVALRHFVTVYDDE